MTTRAWITGIAAIAALATVLVSGTVVLYGAIGYLDPWIYTGYIQSYGDLLERFGRTYYSTRVGALWPSAILYEGLGDAAYVVSRWLTLFAIGMGTVFFLRRLGRPIIAFAGGCALMASTPLLVELADDYTQEIAIAYAVVALACAMSRKAVMWVVAGALGSLAVNSHESVLYMIIPLLVFVIIFHVQGDDSRGRGRRILGRLTAGLSGFILVQIALSLIMAARFGWERSNWYFQEISVDLSRNLASGLARNWEVPFANTYLLVTVTTFVVAGWIALTGIAAYVQRERSAMRLLVAPLAGGTTLVALILISHFIIGSGFVGWPFMLVMAVVPTLLLAWAALQIIWSQSHLPSWPAVAASAVAIALALVVARYLPGRDLWLVLWITAVATAVGTAGLAMMLRRHSSPPRVLGALGIGAIAVVAVLLPTSPFATTDGARGVYLSSLNGPAAMGHDVWALARAFQREVEEQLSDGEYPRFYYSSDSNAQVISEQVYGELIRGDFNWRDSIQSTYLWAYSCMSCDVPHPFPEMNAATRRFIADSKASPVIVMSESPAQVRRATGVVESVDTGLRASEQPIRVVGGRLQLWLQFLRRGRSDQDDKRRD